MSAEVEMESNELLLFQDCLLCGSTDPCLQIKISDQEKWAQDFCKLYDINKNKNYLLPKVERLDVDTDLKEIIRISYYCSDCFSELWSIAKLYSSIEEINAQLAAIQLQCESKLKACVKSLKELQEKVNQNLVENCDPNLNEGKGIIKMKMNDLNLKNYERKHRLLQCMRLKRELPVPVSQNCEFGLNDIDITDTASDSDAVIYLKNNQNARVNGEYSNNNIDSEYPDLDLNSDPVKIIDPFQDLKLKFGLQNLSVNLPRLVFITSSSRYRSDSNLSEVRFYQNSNGNGNETRVKQMRQKKYKNLDVSKSVSCSYKNCDKIFPTEEIKVEHIRRFHEGLDWPFPCEICQKPNYSYRNWVDHQNIHKGRKPYQCPDPSCPKRFETRMRLENHISKQRIRLRKIKQQRLNRIQGQNQNKSLRKELPKLKLPPNIHVKDTDKKLESNSNEEESVSELELASKPDQNQDQHKGNDQGQDKIPSEETILKMPLATEMFSVTVEPEREPESESENEGKETTEQELQQESEIKSEPELEPESQSESEIEVEIGNIPRHGFRYEGPINLSCAHSKCIGNKFESKSLLLEHVKTVHKVELKKPYNCLECQKPCGALKPWQEHGNTHKGLTPFKCPAKNCRKRFCTTPQLRKHQINMHIPPRYQCEQPNCGKFFKFGHQLKLHSKVHQETLSSTSASSSVAIVHTCKKCGKCFCTEKRYKIHLNTHEEEEDEDGKTSKSKKSTIISCNECNKIFTSKAYLNFHIRSVHRNNDYPIRCSLCEFGTNDNSRLKKHMTSVHSDERLFTCDVCERIFKTQSHLSKHKKSAHVHPDDDDDDEFKSESRSFLYPCPLCGKKFSQRLKLNIHLRSIHREKFGVDPGPGSLGGKGEM